MLRETPKPLVHVPAITPAQMAIVEQLMVSEYQIEPVQMLELAGRHLAHLARIQFLKGRADAKGVAVLAGNANCGAGAISAARRLHQWGANVRLLLAHPVEDYHGEALRQLSTVQRQGVIILENPPQGVTLIIDGLYDGSIEGNPVGRTAELIEWANKQLAPVLALDVPVGLDPTTGKPQQPTMRASATLSTALPKAGILKDSSRAMVGEIFLADISVPPALYAAPGLDLKVGPIFSESDIVRLR